MSLKSGLCYLQLKTIPNWKSSLLSFLQTCQGHFILGPLHLLFLLPEMFFSQMITWLSLVKVRYQVRTSPSQMSPHCIHHSLIILSKFIFFIAFITLWNALSFACFFLSLSIQAAITKYHRLGGLKTTEIYFSQFWRLGSLRSRHKLGHVWWEPSPWFIASVLFLCPHMVEGVRDIFGAFFY